MSVKPTNPKDAVGVTKTPFSTIPMPVLAELGAAMLEGALKYGRHNYRAAGVRASVYFDAVMARHLPAWWEGEDIDPDSGLNHITKAIASLVVLRDSMIMGNWVDDRPITAPAGWLTENNKKVAAILAKYPSPVLPFTEKQIFADPTRHLPGSVVGHRSGVAVGETTIITINERAHGDDIHPEALVSTDRYANDNVDKTGQGSPDSNGNESWQK